MGSAEPVTPHPTEKDQILGRHATTGPRHRWRPHRATCRSFPSRARQPAGTSPLRRGLCSAALALAIIAGRACGSPAPQPAEAALAVQEAVVEAIARAERSVVAIARVRKTRTGPSRSAANENGARLTPQPLGLPEALPTSPDFIPNEYATGVIWDRDGHIVTNHHVLGDPADNDYYVWVRRRPFKVVHVEVPERVRAGDPWTDLAVLKIAADGLEPITLGDASVLRKGMVVIALGNPYAIARDGEVSASWGIVSNLRRAAPADPRSTPLDPEVTALHQYGTLIHTDARLDVGTSGGALVNLRGELVGLTTSLAAVAGAEGAAGFAIPVDATFRATVETLRQGRQPAFGFLGVQPDHLPLSRRQNGDAGARVLRVVAGTPAERAGVRQDDVITHVDGQIVEDRNTLLRILSSMPAETPVTLTVERGGGAAGRSRPLTLEATLSKKYVETLRPAFAEVAERSWRGLRVDYPSALPPPLSAQAIQGLDREGCVAVAAVERDSPAWEAGLRGGECISHVGRQRVATPAEFYDAVDDVTGEVALRMTIPRGDAGVRRIRPAP